MQKIWCMYTMKYYSAIKRNKLGLFIETWLDLETVIPSEVSQTEENKYCILTPIKSRKVVQMIWFALNLVISLAFAAPVFGSLFNQHRQVEGCSPGFFTSRGSEPSGHSPPPHQVAVWQHLQKHFWLSEPRPKDACGIWLRVNRDATKHPAMCRAASHAEEASSWWQ